MFMISRAVMPAHLFAEPVCCVTEIACKGHIWWPCLLLDGACVGLAVEHDYMSTWLLCHDTVLELGDGQCESSNAHAWQNCS